MPKFLNKSTINVVALKACLVLGALQLAMSNCREELDEIYYYNGMSYLEKQDYIKARIELRNALQKKPDMIAAWRALAKIDEHEKNWPSLAGSLRNIAELDPKDVDARVRLSKLFLLSNAVEQALKTTNEAIEIEPQNPRVLELKAVVLFRLRDAVGATQAAKKALEIDPNSADARVILASAKFLQGDSDGALKDHLARTS